VRFRFTGEGLFLLAIGLFGAGVVSFKWLFFASNRGGFPLFSWETWEATKWYFIFAAAYVGIRVIWFIARRGRTDSSDED
jgi:hypothetical protein